MRGWSTSTAAGVSLRILSALLTWTISPSHAGEFCPFSLSLGTLLACRTLPFRTSPVLLAVVRVRFNLQLLPA